MPGVFEIPDFPVPVMVRPTSAVNKWVNLRELPTVVARDLGDVKLGESWEAYGAHADNLGNIWYAVRNKSSNRIGWAAAYFNGVQWLEEVA